MTPERWKQKVRETPIEQVQARYVGLAGKIRLSNSLSKDEVAELIAIRKFLQDEARKGK